MASEIRKKGALLRPRLRVVCGDEIALGPGKIELLAKVAATGSLNQAAQELGMSYMRAWTLVKTMNRCFREPVLVAVRGGKSGGGMELTPTGKQALALYQAMESTALLATAKSWEAMQKLLAR